MKCPQCESTSYRKNGHRSGKQNYLCKNCRRQFLEPSSSQIPSAESNSSNGYTQSSLAEASELALVEQLPADKEQQFVQIQQFVQPPAKSISRISILLLDVENLKLDINAETFLAGLCNYPLQVKIAFANWRNSSIGKQDAELYERGYQLIHVPYGKDSADAKMIALGSSILRQYPRVKEVFVCSCDGILTHLCNQLQNQGLTVYWVRRQNRTLKVENRNTGSVNHYSLAVEKEIPSFEEFVQKIEALIKAEQESITTRLSKLTTIATLFQERCHLEIDLNSSDSSPEILQEDEINPILEAKSTLVKSNASATPGAISINSKEELEQALIQIIQEMKLNSPHERVSVAKLGMEVQNKCGEPARTIVKKLKLGNNFTKFLQSCPLVD